jgi:uncharacterized phage protein gp47/JayE
MAFEFKDKEQLVNDVTASILDKLPDIDFSDGEPLKTIVEAIMNELDLQYWQLEQVYENSFIDTAIDEDLSNLVKILGISRLEAVSSEGKVKFFRETPATLDYTIPAGTLVETLPDSNGDIIRFETKQNVVLLTGQTQVYADVKAVEPGAKSNVTFNKIMIINNPPIGIESVINDEAIIGGEDAETDEVLRERAKTALESSGLGTINAITNKIANTAGVKSVSISDMARGIGTMDILVLGDSLPMPSSKITELNDIVQNIKAGGVDFKIIEPTALPTNITMSLTLMPGSVIADVSTVVNTAIANYFNSLQIGESFIKNQLAREVLNTSDKIVDISITVPAANVTATSNQIITLGTTTLS